MDFYIIYDCYAVLYSQFVLKYTRGIIEFPFSEEVILNVNWGGTIL